jgi:glycosyltransferase involved in cell wall biosynthesis
MPSEIRDKSRRLIRSTRAAEEIGSVTLTLMVACYDESENIVATLQTLIRALGGFLFPWEIIIIDDASRDDSATLVEAFLRDHDHLPLRLACNSSNQGLAQSYLSGAALGRGDYYRLICGDNVEPIETLAAVFDRLGEADMIVPFHSNPPRRTALRRWLSRLYTGLVNLISGYRLSYYNGLPILRRSDVMRWHSNRYGFGFQADLLVRLLDQGRSFVEVPVRVIDRCAGTSSALRARNLLSIACTLLDLVIRRMGRTLSPQRRPMQGRSLLAGPPAGAADDALESVR